MHVFLAETGLVGWVTDFKSRALDAASALLAMRECKEPMTTFIARSAFNVAQAIARSVIQVALQIVADHAEWITITGFTTEVLIEAVGVGLTLIAFLADDMRCTDASARLFLAQRFRWAVAWFAVGEAEIAGATGVTLSPDDVRLALTLAAKGITFE